MTTNVTWRQLVKLSRARTGPCAVQLLKEEGLIENLHPGRPGYWRLTIPDDLRDHAVPTARTVEVRRIAGELRAKLDADAIAELIEVLREGTS